MTALSASTGAKLWSSPVAVNGNPPAMANGVVYFDGLDNNVYALNASTGALLWSFTTGGSVSSSPAVANGVVYVASSNSGNATAEIYALNANTGALLWKYTTNDLKLFPLHCSSHAVADGVVYIGSLDHNVYALNANTGAKLWSYTTGGAVISSPSVANGVVYVGSFDQSVYALNANTGARLWSYLTGNAVYSSPAVANGVVYIGSNDGNEYALNASTGAKLWTYSTGPNLISSSAVVDGAVYFTSLVRVFAFSLGGAADLLLRVQPSTMTVHQGDLLTFAFPVWNLGPANADYEVLNTQVPEGTTLDYVRISGTPGLGTCTTPPYGGTGEIVCHENSAMAPNTTWTVRVVVKVTAPAGTVITESAATMADTPDPNLANNTATVSITVQ